MHVTNFHQLQLTENKKKFIDDIIVKFHSINNNNKKKL